MLRPGFIWGAGNEMIAGIGQSLGRLHLVVGVNRTLPLTYVENCADCFLTALESPVAVGETYNVVDDETVTAWRYLGKALAEGAARGRRIPLPYSLGIGFAKLASLGARLLLGPTAKLPGLFVPIKFRARFSATSLFESLTSHAAEVASQVGFRRGMGSNSPGAGEATPRRLIGNAAGRP